ncbi:MAG: hypothetical protein ABEN55_10235 [Bradymonadaceae bacterium]
MFNETTSKDPGPCEPDAQGERSLVSQSRTYVKEYTWDGNTTTLKSDGSVIKLNAVWIDEAQMGAYYYNASGNRKSRAYTRKVKRVPSNYLSKPVGTQIHAMDTFGTCGYGFVSKNGIQTPQVATRAGTAPSSCPSAP